MLSDPSLNKELLPVLSIVFTHMCIFTQSVERNSFGMVKLAPMFKLMAGSIPHIHIGTPD